MAAHARLGASGAHRWAACPGSVAAEEGLPSTSSTAANLGTAMHELAELVLRDSSTCADDWIGKALPESNAFTVDQDMANVVTIYVDYVRSFSGLHYYEQRVDLSEWVPDSFGTADAIVLDGSVLRVIDLKTGHQRVDAHENLQGALYALGALSDFELTHPVSEVVVSIVQPRLDAVSEWTVSVADLLRMGEWFAERAAVALSDNAPRIPGEKQCTWCKAKARCPALKSETERVTLLDFDNIDEPALVDDLTDEQLRHVMDNKKLIEGWFSAVEALISDRLNNGGEFPGYKLVAGRSSRAWVDAENARPVLVELLGDKAVVESLVSPAQAETLLGKKRKGEVADLIAKTQGKPSLAPESDSRPGVGVTSADFD
jgi:hypothetical protein